MCLHDAFIRALSKAGKSPSEIDMVMCGDLLDQCVGSCFALKDLEIPFVGMYGACSTMALTLCNACFAVDAGANTVAVGASSHFASSERQFRFPLCNPGSSVQWTALLQAEAATEKHLRDLCSLSFRFQFHVLQIPSPSDNPHRRYPLARKKAVFLTRYSMGWYCLCCL